jgi:hypothetical protein
MPIAKLPPLPGGIWTSVLVALSAQLERMTNSDYKPLFVVYEDVGKNSIYAQGSVSPESRYLLEIQSNTFLDEKLTDRDVQVLRILGWQLPNDANPNYYYHSSARTNRQIKSLLLVLIRL